MRKILVYESIIRYPREMSRGKQEKICISIDWGKRKSKNKCLQYKNRRRGTLSIIPQNSRGNSENQMGHINKIFCGNTKKIDMRAFE